VRASAAFSLATRAAVRDACGVLAFFGSTFTVARILGCGAQRTTNVPTRGKLTVKLGFGPFSGRPLFTKAFPVTAVFAVGAATSGLMPSAGVTPLHQNGLPAASLVTGFIWPVGTMRLGILWPRFRNVAVGTRGS